MNNVSAYPFLHFFPVVLAWTAKKEGWDGIRWNEIWTMDVTKLDDELYIIMKCTLQRKLTDYMEPRPKKIY